jgi:hypothetical protein
MKINSPLTSGIFAGLLAIYYAITNFLTRSISTPAFVIGLIFLGACTTLFIIYNRRELTNTRKINFVLYLGVIIATLAIVFLMSYVDYIATGKLLGIVVGALAGGLLFAKDKDKLKGNWLVAAIIIGVVLFAVLRSITFDVQTMGSASLEPKVYKGEKVLINNLSFGLCVPFLPFHIARWGNPSIGDLVVVVGPNASPFLREVLNVNENQVQVNVDGWLPREQLMARAKPL